MISENFRENTPHEMRAFIDYCARQGWCSFVPRAGADNFGVDYFAAIRWAPDCVKACVRLGLCAFPKPAPAVPVGRAFHGRISKGLICGGEFERHRWQYLPGIGEHCTRCNALPTRKHNRKKSGAQTINQEPPTQ